MKYVLFSLICFFSFVVSYGEDKPTLATTDSTGDTKSVIVAPQQTTSVTQSAEQPQKCCNVTDKKIVYRNKRNIAPGAVQQGLNLSYCSTKVDACCNKTSSLEQVDVPACVPPCSCKESVRTSKDGKRVVYDYGHYEVVLKARSDDSVEVNYRRRLLNR